MPSGILVINLGSSSVKISLFDISTNNLIASYNHKLSCIGYINTTEVTNFIQQSLIENFNITKIVHRVVHGGKFFKGPIKINLDSYSKIKELAIFAPLHNTNSLKIIDLCNKLFKRTPNYACFDTAFFSDLPTESKIYSIPYKFYKDYSIQKYGFHGINHQYCLNLLPDDLKFGKVVILHLGSGASICSCLNAKPLDTTMGFTPLDGLIMSTRTGSIDPGIILYMVKLGYSFDELDNILNHKSGLLGLSCKCVDFKELLENQDTNKQYKLAIDVYFHNLKKHFLSMIACLNGVDTVVFTGGIGQNSNYLRRRLCFETSFLGWEMDNSNNTTSNQVSYIHKENSKIKVAVIEADENLAMYQLIKELD